MTQTSDIIICGAGIAGVATAYFLAVDQDITNVLLVDKHAPLSQTTAKSGENYRNWWPNQTMVQFISRSIDIMEHLAEATDNVFQMTRRGYVYATTMTDPTTLVDRIVERYSHMDMRSIRVHDDLWAPETAAYILVPNSQREGADILLDRELIQARFPHFTTDVTAAIHVRRAGDISVQQLGTYLLNEAKRRGARVIRGEVIGINQDSSGVTDVTIATQQGTERIATRTFVDAAGPFANRILSLIGLELPLHTIFQQKIAMQDPHSIVPRDAPFTIYLDEQMLDWSAEERNFWQSEPDGDWLLGQFPGGLHIRPEGSGDSTWLKLGWAFNRKSSTPQWNPSVNEAFPEIMLRGASRLVPGLATYRENLPKPLVHYGGYYVKTPENLPVIGPLNVEGAHIVGGLAGYGTMAGCAAGELCAAWITEGTLPVYADALAPARYDNAAYRSSLVDLEVEGEL